MSFASLGSGILGGDDVPITTLRHNVRQWLPYGAFRAAAQTVGATAAGSVFAILRHDGLATIGVTVDKTVKLRPPMVLHGCRTVRKGSGGWTVSLTVG